MASFPFLDLRGVEECQKNVKLSIHGPDMDFVISMARAP
jgi:hypothetical protein